MRCTVSSSRLVVPALVALVIVAASGVRTDPVAQEIAARAVASPIHGMTVSTPRGSSVWAGDDMVGTIAELADLGVNWIAIHPYARIERDGQVTWRGATTDAPTTPVAAANSAPTTTTARASPPRMGPNS